VGAAVGEGAPRRRVHAPRQVHEAEVGAHRIVERKAEAGQGGITILIGLFEPGDGPVVLTGVEMPPGEGDWRVGPSGPTLLGPVGRLVSGRHDVRHDFFFNAIPTVALLLVT
jgi:hypothetical protein